MIPLARSAALHDITRRVELVHDARAVSFSWSRARLATASLVLIATAAPAVIGFALSGAIVRWTCLAWLLGIASMMHGLGRRAADDGAVLSIDQRGILDRRLMQKRIEWHEIAVICGADERRGHVLDIALRRPDRTLADTRFWVRVGAICQRGYDVPAITISMLLLDGRVGDLLDAVALFRPELLPHQNRR